MAQTTLTRILTTAPLLFALALLTACMQTEESAKIEKSGKGLITIKTVVDKAMTEGMVEMMQGMGMAPGGGFDITAQLDRKMRALRCHESQHRDPEGMEQRVREWYLEAARDAGLADGRSAERFFVADAR